MFTEQLDRGSPSALRIIDDTHDNYFDPTSDQRAQGAGLVIGNKRSGIYHLPSCTGYNKVSEKNRQYFKTKEEAEKAGYRMAGDCP